MKTKKLFTSACAALLTCSIGAACFAGCEEKCDHVYTWNTVKEATCTAEGSRDGLCGICGDVITEAIPVNPDAHAYGEWSVTNPTQTGTGSATLTCTLNSSHKIDVTLPALTDSGYTVKEITPATAVKEGETQYTYAHEKGAIVFSVTSPKKSISSVQDLVELAAENAGQISKSAGAVEMPVVGVQHVSKNYCEFGNDYTHIYNDGDNREFYCTDNPDFYAIEINGVKYSLDSNGYPTQKTNAGGTPSQALGLSSGYMQGFMYSLGYTGISEMYGAEGVINKLYSLASANTNNDFAESYESLSDGQFKGNFSFGYFSDSNNRFCLITVEFVLYDTLSVRSVSVVSTIYGEGGYTAEVIDSNTTYYHEKEDAETDGVERIDAVQERGQDVSTPVGANPYPQGALFIKSFNVKCAGEEVGDEPVEASAGSPTVFTITDIKHISEEISNIALDPVSVYLREGGTDLQITASTGSDSKIKVNAVIIGASVTIRCFRLEDVKIVLKTESGNFEKVININVGNAKGPSALEAQVNMYYDTGYQWQSYSTVVPDEKSLLKIYVGQTLEFDAIAPEEEQSYTDASYTATITSDNAANANIYDNNKFIASAPGEYEIEIVAKVAVSANKYASQIIYITAIEKPDLATLFGEYTAEITDPERAKATIVFATPEPAKEHDEETNTDIDVYKGTVTISFLGATETLSYTFIPATIVTGENGRVYNPPVLRTSHLSGAEDLDCSITINDAYGLILRHSREVSGQFEEVVLVVAK